ncbi:putative dinucleotide-binding enzyme [Rheinheimera pacifica]|uniref:NADPH-dependent F420 reductase n=1 Tax=Rheinheimera pacifica TaxID=173990 RepID=UPI00286492F7|nr:NAD(P)-binding domain-containing protein [Rheinheimera pacifica]MDR6984379.1 putative dinucleotide-binding enzyme [Rheinheimera pacifica]
MMNIGIIGAGAIGAAIAKLLTQNGIKVGIANSRGPASLAALVAGLGANAQAVTVQEASRADIVFLAVNWSKLPQAVAALGPWQGRIVVDTNNPIEAPLFKPFDLAGKASSQVVAGMLPGAQLVKAFNHLPPALLANPAAESGKRVLFYSGEHQAAKQTVAALIEQLGFFGIDLGNLEQGRLAQFPGGPLPALNLVKHN